MFRVFVSLKLRSVAIHICHGAMWLLSFKNPSKMTLHMRDHMPRDMYTGDQVAGQDSNWQEAKLRPCDAGAAPADTRLQQW